jgi:hypothetical protein
MFRIRASHPWPAVIPGSRATLTENAHPVATPPEVRRGKRILKMCCVALATRTTPSPTSDGG